MNRLLASATWILYFFISFANAAEDDKIHALLDGLHDDAANARFEQYFNRYSEEAVFLGTDASERWTKPEFQEYARSSFEAGRGWTYRVRERHLARSGNVVWFDEQLDNSQLGRCRGTGVVIQEQGKWKVAHYSLTMLVPNEIARTVGKQSGQILEKKDDAGE